MTKLPKTIQFLGKTLRLVLSFFDPPAYEISFSNNIFETYLSIRVSIQRDGQYLFTLWKINEYDDECFLLGEIYAKDLKSLENKAKPIIKRKIKEVAAKYNKAAQVTEKILKELRL